MNLRAGVVVTLLLVAVLGFVAWNNNRQPAPAGEPRPQATPAPGAAAPAPTEPDLTADPGVRWTVPKGWLTEITGGMRLATYIVPGATREADAECAVYYFGPGAGGGVDANLERWVGEFEDHRQQELKRREVRGMKLVVLEVAGTFRGHTMRTDAAAGPHAGWALRGAIAQGPRGDLFFKLTGPAATVNAAARPFEAMLSSLAPASPAPK